MDVGTYFRFLEKKVTFVTFNITLPLFETNLTLKSMGYLWLHLKRNMILFENCMHCCFCHQFIFDSVLHCIIGHFVLILCHIKEINTLHGIIKNARLLTQSQTFSVEKSLVLAFMKYCHSKKALNDAILTDEGKS